MNIYAQRCIAEYQAIVNANPKIDSGHSVNHVCKVESLTSEALGEYLNNVNQVHATFDETHDKPIGKYIPKDVILRVKAASFLHEVGDSKFDDGTIKTKEQLISEILDRVFHDYPNYSNEMRQDIINMIDYCGTTKWGNRIPNDCMMYQLIPRYADRVEATGIIGIIRTITFSYSKRSNHPLCREEDEFPTTMDELNKIAPPERWQKYTTGNKRSVSGFSHYLDKIVHINGDDVPIQCLKQKLDQGQAIIKQFILDFTNVHGKKFDIDAILNQIDHQVYSLEVAEMKEIQRVLRQEGSKWIK
jgi:hypothetical protein